MSTLQPHDINGLVSADPPWPIPTSPPTPATTTEAARYQHARILQTNPGVQSTEPWSPMHLLPLVTTGLFGSGLITAVILPQAALVLLVTIIMASLIATTIIGVRVHDRHLQTHHSQAGFYASQHTLSYGRRVVRAEPGAAALNGVEANSLPLPQSQHTAAEPGSEPLGHPGICRKSCESAGQRGDGN